MLQCLLDAGWSDKLLPIVDQLCQANASEGGRPIVVLAERDKEEMEEDLAKHGINDYKSRIIFRCSHILIPELLIVALKCAFCSMKLCRRRCQSCY